MRLASIQPVYDTILECSQSCGLTVDEVLQEVEVLRQIYSNRDKTGIKCADEISCSGFGNAYIFVEEACVSS